MCRQLDPHYCRDFLHGSCDRIECKYEHASISDLISKGEDVGRLIFCRDFQENRCDRPVCRFLHASKDDEEYFRHYQQLPPHLMHGLPRHILQLLLQAFKTRPVVSMLQVVPQMYYPPQGTQSPASFLQVLPAAPLFVSNVQQPYSIPVSNPIAPVPLPHAVVPMGGPHISPFVYP